SLDDHTSGDVLPKRDEKLPGECGNHRLAEPTAVAVDALMEPATERRVWLVSQPQPRKLEHGCPQPRIAGLADTLFPLDRPALPWRRRQSGIGSDLSAVGKMPEQSFRPKNHRELCSDTFQVHQHPCGRGILLVRRREYVISVGLNSLDLFKNQLKAV